MELEKKVADLEQELEGWKRREGEREMEDHQTTEDPHIYEETSVVGVNQPLILSIFIIYCPTLIPTAAIR